MADDEHGTKPAGTDSAPAVEDPDELIDELPADLQPALAEGDYVFPNNSRRRIPAVLYALFSVAAATIYFTLNDSPAVNGGWLAGAGLLALFALYSWVAGGNLNVDEREALVTATVDVGFAVGHASAQLGWRGLLCRPTWRVLVYSSEDPPLKRALLFVDGIDGRVTERIVQDNPEDWSEYCNEETPRVDATS